jgi:Flp pilus assembly protein TadG
MVISRTSRLIHSVRRPGSVLPILAVTLVLLMAFLALAIDIGMLVIAKTQAQNAADLASLTAARTLTGDATSTYNQGPATTNAQNVLTYNTILGQSIQSSQLGLTFGTYDYNQTSQTFSANFPGTSGSPTTAVTATVTVNNAATAFSSVLGFGFLPTVTATATAVHRPRDIALVMDLSGSMRFGTCTGFDFYTTSRTCNNPDPNYPTFGAYSSSSAGMVGPTTAQTSAVDSYTISPSNITATNTSYTRTYANNFYQNAAYASPLIRAFDSYSSTDGGNTWTAPTTQRPQLPPTSYATTPGGDAPLFQRGSAAVYASDVFDVVGGTTANILWELDGYSAYAAGKSDTSGSGGVPTVWTQVDYSNAACQFNGYTQGPNYYGKTFFIWPPDPRNGAITSTTSLTTWLAGLGITNTTDQTTIATNWNTWLGQGSTGLTNLQNWLTGTSTMGGPYKTTGPFVPGSSSKAPIYYAVCRLFNRAYPAGSANGAFSGDWRAQFFGTTNNTLLFKTTGSLAVPGASTYTINYNAILSWISGAQDPFPQQMRAGRVKYYGSIPTSLTGTWPSYGSTDQRFWKEVIDYTLGFRQTSATAYTDVSGMVGYGGDFIWGTATLTTPPVSPMQYMSYTDIPARPRLRCWFGPLNMIDMLQNYNLVENQSATYFFLQPGDSYEAPLYTGKEAFIGAIGTMKNNHPNDWFSMICYSWPRYASSGKATSSGGNGRFNCVRSPMGPNYAYAQAALLFPFSTINADGSPNYTEITPYDADPANSNIPSANFMDTPRADGDTCFAMGLMLAYNQFMTTLPSDTTLRSFVSSSPITFPSGMAGGMGRKGAQKVIIFETDGLANCTATASLAAAPSGTYNYYPIRYDMNNPAGSEYPAVAAYGINNTTVLNQVNTLVQQLASDCGTTRNPFRLYAIGFGPVFTGPDASSALTTLQNMQYYAGTQSSASTPLASIQVITGTDSQMATNMSTAYTTILENGVQIALIK